MSSQCSGASKQENNRGQQLSPVSQSAAQQEEEEEEEEKCDLMKAFLGSCGCGCDGGKAGGRWTV